MVVDIRPLIHFFPQGGSAQKENWWMKPLDEEEDARLFELAAMAFSLSSHKFKCCERREEVQLRARKRGRAAGPEDGLAEKLATLNGISGGKRWLEYHKRSRLADKAELEPKLVEVARPPAGATAKALSSWLTESSKARIAELLFVEELKEEFSRVWDRNTRPQLDAGKNPVTPPYEGDQIASRVKALKGKIYLEYCDSDNKFEFDEMMVLDRRLDVIDTNVADPLNPGDAGSAQLPPDADSFVDGWKAWRAELKVLHNFLQTKTGLNNGKTPAGLFTACHGKEGLYYSYKLLMKNPSILDHVMAGMRKEHKLDSNGGVLPAVDQRGGKVSKDEVVVIKMDNGQGFLLLEQAELEKVRSETMNVLFHREKQLVDSKNQAADDSDKQYYIQELQLCRNDIKAKRDELDNLKKTSHN